MSDQPRCDRCASSGWVCEEHDDLAWDAGDDGCDCGAPGMPCPNCNKGQTPRMVAGSTVIWTAKHGWIH